MALDACDAYAASGSSHGILQGGRMPRRALVRACDASVSAGQGQDAERGKDKQQCLVW